MTSDTTQTALRVRILGRDYSVACPAGERESLLLSADHLSKRMQAIQHRGKTLGIERIAVMAALNIARDLLDSQRGAQRERAVVHPPTADAAPPSDENSEPDVNARLARLQHRIESALDESS